MASMVDYDNEEVLERVEMEVVETEVARMKEERGAPPEMDRRWRVPREKVHEVLFLWGFLQEFGGVLKLAPFTLGDVGGGAVSGTEYRHGDQ